jgi:hypothetical protein
VNVLSPAEARRIATKLGCIRRSDPYRPKTLGKWVAAQAMAKGISISAMWHRIYRGKEAVPPTQRVNGRVILLIGDFSGYVGSDVASSG